MTALLDAIASVIGWTVILSVATVLIVCVVAWVDELLTPRVTSFLIDRQRQQGRQPWETHR